MQEITVIGSASLLSPSFVRGWEFFFKQTYWQWHIWVLPIQAASSITCQCSSFTSNTLASLSLVTVWSDSTPVTAQCRHRSILFCRIILAGELVDSSVTACSPVLWDQQCFNNWPAAEMTTWLTKPNAKSSQSTWLNTCEHKRDCQLPWYFFLRYHGHWLSLDQRSPTSAQPLVS